MRFTTCPAPGPDDDYRQLLTRLEVDGIEDVSGSDLLEMTLMALQDMETDDAADAVLAHKLGSRVSTGARRNIVEDLLEISDHGKKRQTSPCMRKSLRLLFYCTKRFHRTSPNRT